MTSSGQTESVSSGFHALIVWFARNHVAANLLMLAVIASGLLVSRQIRQEIYPTFTLDVVEISMEYRGASPEDIEKSILLPIESELRTMEIIREITATASEGSARVQAELVPGSDRNRGLQEITAAIQRINLFPDEAEPPIIALDNGRRRGVMYLSIYGDLSTRGLVQFAREMEERLLSLPDISLVELRGIRKPEIHIEVPQANLRSLGLRLSDIATAVDNAALDVPAGSIKTEAGDYLLKTRERKDIARQYEAIPIISKSDGTKVRLRDIAILKDDFEETQRESYFDGKPSVWMAVYSSESQSPMTVAKAVRRFIDKELKDLPESVGITITFDRSDDYEERINMLLTNGALGLLLVIMALGLFLELRVAFWTAAGIPVSVLGSLSSCPPWMPASI